MMMFLIMMFLQTPKGKKLLKEYLDRFDSGGSRRIARSIIQRFFRHFDCSLSEINETILHEYKEILAKDKSPKTTRREFSALRGFFVFLEEQIKKFHNPISSLNDFKTDRGAQSESLQKYLKGFIATLNTENTQKTYNYQLNSFFLWLDKDLMEITHKDVMAYKDFLQEKNYADSTIWSKVIAVNRFLTYIQRENRKFHNPVDFSELSLTIPKKDRGYGKVMSLEEAERLLCQPDVSTDIGKRDRAILYILAVYGLRANEVAKIRHKHIERKRYNQQQKIWIEDRKGWIRSRPRTAVILNGRALEAFDAWFEVIKREVKISSNMPVFLPYIYNRKKGKLVIRKSRANIPLSPRQVENVVYKYVDKAEIQREGEAISAHSLRHSAFTFLAQSRVPIHEIQKLAGHASILTTMIYVHAVQDYDNHPGMYSPLNK